MPRRTLLDDANLGNHTLQITQAHLARVRRLRAIDRDHALLRSRITDALQQAVPIESGELNAQIVLVERAWSRRTLCPLLTTAELELIEEITPAAYTFAALSICGEKRKVEDKRSCAEAPLIRVSQADLRTYLSQVEICQALKSSQQLCVQALLAGAVIEPGDLTPVLRERTRIHLDQSSIALVLGRKRARKIAQDLGPLYRRRLVICDREGHPLGWHAGKTIAEIAAPLPRGGGV